MTVYQVASNADYDTLMDVSNGITSADTVEFLNAGTFTDIRIGDDGTVTYAPVPVGATFVAEDASDPNRAALSRLIIYSPGVSVQGLRLQANHDYFTAAVADWHLVE